MNKLDELKIRVTTIAETTDSNGASAVANAMADLIDYLQEKKSIGFRQEDDASHKQKMQDLPAVQKRQKAAKSDISE